MAHINHFAALHISLLIHSLDEETLQSVARDGVMNYEKWPSIIEPLLDRLNHIVYNEFPTPKPFPTINRVSQFTLSEPVTQTSTDLTQSPTLTQQPQTPVRTLPPVPPFNSSSTTTPSHVPDSLPPSQSLHQSTAQPTPELPALLLQLLNGIVSTLRTSFSLQPPHTIQRLAELVLSPTQYYKTLPAWLRAVDRVVSVSSTADIFPLPNALPLPGSVVDESLRLTNGVHDNGDGGMDGQGGNGILWTNTDVRNGDYSGIGSDESLGGALLTPIPWLKNGSNSDLSTDSNDTNRNENDGDPDNEMLEELPEVPLPLPPGSGVATGMVPEREHGAVLQGELIRQEQELGVVPANQVLHSNATAIPMDADDLDETPHARGPNIIDTVDMGLQNGRDVQVHISGLGNTDDERADQTTGDWNRTRRGALEADDSNREMSDTSEATNGDESAADADGDIVLVDVDKSEQEEADSTAKPSREMGQDGSDTSAASL